MMIAPIISIVAPFPLVVKECTEEWSEYHCKDREPSEEVCSLCCRNLECHFKEVCSISLEWEDSGVIEYAEKCHEPEHLAAEDLAQIAYFELLFRISSCGDAHLSVKLRVHD